MEASVLVNFLPAISASVLCSDAMPPCLQPLSKNQAEYVSYTRLCTRQPGSLREKALPHACPLPLPCAHVRKEYESG